MAYKGRTRGIGAGPEAAGGMRPEALTEKEIATSSPLALMVWHGGGRYKAPKHLQVVNEWLLELAYGELDVLLVACPPGCAKSSIGSLYGPVWWLGTWPERRSMVVSYAGAFAAGWGAKARNVMAEVGGLWTPAVKVDQAKGSAEEWWLRGAEGRMYAQGVDGQVTGKRVEGLFTLDDMYRDAADADSEAWREKLVSFMQDVVFGRLTPEAKILSLNYRWRQDDLHAWIADTCRQAGMRVKELVLPAIAEGEDELGRMPGEALWPEKYPLEYLRRQEKLVSPQSFASQYMQNPLPPEGTVLRQEWLRFWREEPRDCSEQSMSVDCAFKDKKTSSYVVVQVWGRRADGFYLLDQTRRQMGLADTIDAIKAQKALHPAVWHVDVEDKANGSAVIEALQRDMSLGISVNAVNDGGGKLSRLQAVTPLFKNGLVYLPHPEARPWAGDLQAELLSMGHQGKKARFSDQCDAASIALRRYVGLVRSFVPIEERPLTAAQARARIVDDFDKKQAEEERVRREFEEGEEGGILKRTSWGAAW